jgi:hypothetical protein
MAPDLLSTAMANAFPHDPQPVPEPATLLLTALGAGGLIARRVRAR